MSGSPAADALRRWLLHGPAQLRAGEHAGGVVGSLDAAGRAGYVYGEITGYYLHWLAGLEEPGATRAAHAQAAIDWCERQFAAGVPPTRVYLTGAPPDWRNAAVFLFDLAMLAGGIARAVRAGLVELPRPLLAHLTAELERLVVDGELTPLRRLDATTTLPDRWSTRFDRFELKAVTRVLMLQELGELPPALHAACLRCVTRRAPEAAGAPVEWLHPTLYFLEGVLACDRTPWPGAAALLQRVLAFDNGRGELPEAPDSTAVLRSDVMAQALRVGVVLQRHGSAGAPTPAQLDRLATALAARVTPEGALAFRPDVEPPLPNVWCAMFAEQALRWHAADPAAPPAPELIV